MAYQPYSARGAPGAVAGRRRITGYCPATARRPGTDETARPPPGDNSISSSRLPAPGISPTKPFFPRRPRTPGGRGRMRKGGRRPARASAQVLAAAVCRRPLTLAAGPVTAGEAHRRPCAPRLVGPPDPLRCLRPGRPRAEPGTRRSRRGRRAAARRGHAGIRVPAPADIRPQRIGNRSRCLLALDIRNAYHRITTRIIPAKLGVADLMCAPNSAGLPARRPRRC